MAGAAHLAPLTPIVYTQRAGVPLSPVATNPLGARTFPARGATMATTLTLHVETTLTHDATAGNVEEMTLPVGTQYLIVRPLTNDGYFSRTSHTDGAAISATARKTLSADTTYALATYGQRVVYLASTANSGTMEVEASLSAP